MRTLACVMLAAILCVPVHSVLAAEEEDTERSANEIVERVLDRVRAWFEERERQPEPEDADPLGKTVRIRFEIVPAEADGKPLSVLCATRHYGLEAHMQGGGGEFHFEVAGTVSSVEKGGDILLTYEVGIEFEGNEGSGSVRAEGSAVVAFGKPRTLACFGDKSLKAVVDVEE